VTVTDQQTPAQVNTDGLDAHRTAGGEMIVAKSDTLTTHLWLDAEGRLHRDGGPAKTVIKDGLLDREEWWTHGEPGQIDRIVNGGEPGTLPDDVGYTLSKQRHEAAGGRIENLRTSQGTQTECWRDHDGRVHRLDGPAITIFDPDNETVRQEWFISGVRHREDDKPAIVIPYRGPVVDESGVPLDTTDEMSFYRYGRLHRENGKAAVIARETKLAFDKGTYQCNPYSRIEEFWEDGQRHRDKSPAVVQVYADGVHDGLRDHYEQWWSTGSLNRGYGPAVIQVYAGSVRFHWVHWDRPAPPTDVELVHWALNPTNPLNVRAAAIA
jgi:hypothetical protein